MELKYYKEEDIIHIIICEGPERGSTEINPNITLELNENREIIGIEILEASKFIRDFILESAQAKMMSLDYKIASSTGQQPTANV